MYFFFQYPPRFKEEVRLYAEAIGQRATARLFNISQKRIFEWITEAKNQPESTSRKRAAVLQSRRKNLSKLRKSLPCYTGSMQHNNFRSQTQTQKELDIQIEKEIEQWLKSQAPRKVPSTELRLKAKDIYTKHGRMNIDCSYGWYRRFKQRVQKRDNDILKDRHEEDYVILSWLLRLYDNNQVVAYKELQSYAQNALQKMKPNFKASAGWALRFLKRNHLLIDSENHYGKDLPPELETKAEKFRSEVSIILEHFPASCVGCMDEIPVCFSTPLKRTSNVHYAKDEHEFTLEESKTSRLRKQSLKNCDATVILAILADGTLLPPMVIVKGQQSSSIDQVYNAPQSPVVAYYSSTTEPSVTSLEKWVELIWQRNTNAKSVLIWDSYEIHSTLESKFENSDIKFLMIPAGCSSKLQPINLTARKSFLDNMEKCWNEYLQPDNDDTNPEKIKLPTTNEIVEWVQNSYDLTMSKKEELAKSFKIFSRG